MADDSMITEQLRQLTLDERLELEEAINSSTDELEQLQDAAEELVASLGNDVQHDSTIPEIPRRKSGESLDLKVESVSEQDFDSHSESELDIERDAQGGDGFDPYNRA